MPAISDKDIEFARRHPNSAEDVIEQIEETNNEDELRDLIERDIHIPREGWIAERRREQIVRELEHELGTPDMTQFPTVDEDVKDIQEQYANGEISLFELEEALEELLK